jgi:hypothetical protein
MMLTSSAKSNRGANVNSFPLQLGCVVLSCLAMAAGALGMVASVMYMTSGDILDITAGSSGFVAGAVLIGSGLISLAILLTRPGPMTPRISEGGWGSTGDVRRSDAL